MLVPSLSFHYWSLYCPEFLRNTWCLARKMYNTKMVPHLRLLYQLVSGPSESFPVQYCRVKPVTELACYRILNPCMYIVSTVPPHYRVNWTDNWAGTENWVFWFLVQCPRLYNSFLLRTKLLAPEMEMGRMTSTRLLSWLPRWLNSFTAWLWILYTPPQL